MQSILQSYQTFYRFLEFPKLFSALGLAAYCLLSEICFLKLLQLIPLGMSLNVNLTELWPVFLDVAALL